MNQNGPDPSTARGLRSSAGLFLFSVALLMAEIALTRLARIHFGYAYQLLIISLAISGLGFGGLPVLRLRDRPPATFRRTSAHAAALFAALIGLPHLGVAAAVASGWGSAHEQLFALAFLGAVFGLYFVAGMLLCAVLSAPGVRVARAYAVNLVGAAVGAFLVVVLMEARGTDGAMLAIQVSAWGAAACFLAAAPAGRWATVGLLLGASLLPLAVARTSTVEPGRVRGTQVAAPRSNSFSQVAVSRTNPRFLARELGPGTEIDRQEMARLGAFRIVYDRLGSTNAIAYGRLAEAGFLRSDIVYFPYLLKHGGDVLILGAGGGVDVAKALLADSRAIVAVELNPLIVDLARLAGSAVFDDPRVEVVVGEGRNYVSGTDRRFDLIYLPQARGFGGRGINAHHDAENYLNTEEAYRSYLDRLKPGGLLAISQRNWLLKEHLQVAGQVVAERQGDVAGRLALVSGQRYSVAMIKTEGFDPEERLKLEKNADALGFPVSFPRDTALAGPQAHVVDDRPYIWDATLLANLFDPGYRFEDEKNEEARAMTLRFLLLVALFGLIATAGLSAAAVRGEDRRADALRLAGYFTAIGLGFIVFELVLVQRTFVFLAHPTYSLAITLSCFLLFGGLGSLWTSRIEAARWPTAARRAGFLLVASLAGLALSLDLVFTGLLFLPLAARVVLCVALLAVPCFLAGFFVPLGLRAAGLVSTRLVPWMWGINGVAAVLGGSLATLVSFAWGFRIALGVAAVGYLIATGLLGGVGAGLSPGVSSRSGGGR